MVMIMSSSHNNAFEQSKKLKVCRKNKVNCKIINNYCHVESARVCGFGCLSPLGTSFIRKRKSILEAELLLEDNGKERFQSNADMLILFFAER